MPRRLRESEINEKRENILNAAREVFLENGYVETTMSEIAKRASMPVSSLYNFFHSKQDIFKSAGLHDDIYSLRPEYDRRRKAILDTALELIGQHGYSAVTLEEITARLGMPKASFYQFFDSKEELFSALLTESPLHESAYELEQGNEDHLCRNGLRSLGQSYLDMGSSPERMAITKMVVHESSEHPEAGQLFYSEGISKVCNMLAQYIRRNLPECKLDDDTLKLASWIFLSSLWASNILFKLMKGAQREFSDTQILDMAVEVFSAWLEKQ